MPPNPSLVQLQPLHILLRAQDPHGPMHPRARVDRDKPPIVIICGRPLIRFPARAAHSFILRRWVHGPRVRWPLAHVRGRHPRPLAPRCYECGRLPSGQTRHVAQPRDCPTALGGVAELDAGVEKAHTAVHECGAVGWVQGCGAGGWLQAGADTTDRAGPMGGPRGGDTCGGHGGWGHGWGDPSCEDTGGEEEGPTTCDGVGAIVEGGTERSGEGCHVVGRKRLEIWTEGLLEDVEGSTDLRPLTFSGMSGGLKLSVFGNDLIGLVEIVLTALVKSRRETNVTRGWHHAVHGRRSRRLLSV